ncbi:hypothetical protein POJ06DRAFT_15457 [Lipomyces tetrasporus]|uniref:Ubiquitin-like domain-containing protein n=1 Tax=Lipomyces tetrasporus TaxID=54092 RepID=A0AAD7VVF6_9ASCO|nr:uncharacterized protein POJ06DRAFT_15457 [Lipomyces tetrasporus]KAJ8104212.1 hypothetical protein POJ06DRAFT_15457 [Lipomyces tetrasporus]
MSDAGAESASSSNDAGQGPSAVSETRQGRQSPIVADAQIPESQASATSSIGHPGSSGRLINLRISTPAALPAPVTSTLGFKLPATTTVETVKRHIADRLQDALLFATGEPWTSTVYTTAIENANEELLGDIKGDTIMRIIFQGRFLTDEMKIGDVIREINDVTFHMMLKQSIIDVLTTAYKQATIPTPAAPVDLNLPPNVAPSVPQQRPAELFGTATTTTQIIPALPNPPPPFGTNIVVYQDPRASTPLMSPYSSLPVVTSSGHLAILLSPQGISNFAAAGISIQEGNSTFVPGVQYAHDSSSFYQPVPADGINSSILAALLHSRAPTDDPHRHHHQQQQQQQQQPGQQQQIHRYSLVDRVRATLSDIRNNAHRLRNTLALTWLFLRLVFFVGLSSGEIGGSRFWTVSAVATVVFLWRANVLALFGREIARRVIPNNNNNHDGNNNNNINGNANNEANGQMARRRFGALGAIFLRPDDDETPPPGNDNVRYRVLRELERVVLVFVGTLVPAVYDTWHRHEVAREEALLQRQREREQQEQREQEEREQQQREQGQPDNIDVVDVEPPAAAQEANGNNNNNNNEGVLDDQAGQDVDIDVEVLAIEGVGEQQLRHRNRHAAAHGL